ncbi:hypothetical protein [Nitrososphaeria virus YSH_922147]|uniref:Uncharacterized protein n=1 Tax=Nitrososphaeria virus YSH_922147 TaxID=3071323 RepID=A0A976YF82_9CAUD|nr:hypothetical protein QKV94_gp45 [Yangshan Harbor Nitrososphaeria virus]UVF62454.1 hypothetical protein [Nitrososphaeria virus YSH_922147]
MKVRICKYCYKKYTKQRPLYCCGTFLGYPEYPETIEFTFLQESKR